jgi:hypothetical protein
MKKKADFVPLSASKIEKLNECKRTYFTAARKKTKRLAVFVSFPKVGGYVIIIT